VDGRIPRWAWVVAGGLVAASLAVFAIGRGGTAVLLGTALAFGALACLLLSEPDRDPAAEDEAKGNARRAQ
jgi:hypothetical protein